MIDAVCLAEWQGEYIDSAFEGGFIGLLLGTLIVAALMAVAVAPFVLRRYDAQVRRLMRLRQRATLPDAWVAQQSGPSPVYSGDGADDPFDQSTLTDLQSAARSRLTAVRRATWIAYGVFAGTSVVLAATLGAALATPDLVGYFIAVCFVGAVPALVNVRPQGSKTFVLLGAVVLGIVLSVLESAGAPPGSDADPVEALGPPLLLAALYFTIAHRKLRAVVVPLTLLLTVVLGGILVAFWCLMFVSCIQQPLNALAWSLASTILALATTVVGASVYGGRKAIDAVARLQERGLVSDISISAGIGLTFIALLFAVGLATDSGLEMWQIALAGAIWAGLPCVAYGVAVARGRRPAPVRSLLVLRVFSRSNAAERLLDAVQTDWRYVGPVYQIAGPDLVRLNVDLYEFGKFVNAKVHELFLFGGVTPEQLLGRLVRHPDREGRFRVNEIFCLETAWRATVEQMMELSDAILLDVRGFGPERTGTAFELDLLVRRGFICRVVAIGDQTTNWNYFDERIRAAGGDPEAVVREHITGVKDPNARFVRALMRVGAGATGEIRTRS